jgi:hypothetical protein
MVADIAGLYGRDAAHPHAHDVFFRHAATQPARDVVVPGRLVSQLSGSAMRSVLPASASMCGVAGTSQSLGRLGRRRGGRELCSFDTTQVAKTAINLLETPMLGRCLNARRARDPADSRAAWAEPGEMPGTRQQHRNPRWRSGEPNR